MARLFRILLAGLACVASLSIVGGMAQTGGNPIVGAWSWQAQDQNGGVTFTTIVYRPDGTFVLTSRFGSGLLSRMWGRYQAQMTGGNQMQISRQFQGALPQQICSGSGLCNPGPMPSTTVTTDMIAFNGADMLIDGGIREMRDPTFGLAQLNVPAVAMTAANQNGGGGGGAQMCPVGARQCFTGWLRTCQTMPTGTGTWWITSAQRC